MSTLTNLRIEVDRTDTQRLAAELADEVAFWKQTAIDLQVAVILGRLPTEADRQGKTWAAMRSWLEANYHVKRAARRQTP